MLELSQSGDELGSGAESVVMREDPGSESWYWLKQDFYHEDGSLMNGAQGESPEFWGCRRRGV